MQDWLFGINSAALSRVEHLRGLSAAAAPHLLLPIRSQGPETSGDLAKATELLRES